MASLARTFGRPGLLLSLALLATSPAMDSRLPLTIGLGGQSLEVYSYQPAGCQPNALLLVIHGSLRDADNYREYVRPAADRWCYLVLVPRFDAEHFPTARFQFCGRTDGPEHRPPEEWTGRLLVRLVDWVRARQRAPDLPYIVLGHSSGGGAASCFAAFTANQAASIVIANPAGLLRPSLSVALPFGFAGLHSDEYLRRYLASPITFLIGDDDGDTAKHGSEVFAMGRAAAEAYGWPFGWRLVAVPRVGHWAGYMLVSPEAIAVLGGGGR